MTKASTDQRRIDMPPHEIIDRLVPRPPVSSDARAVPPLAVELAIPEHHDLGQGVEDGLEDGEEACEPDDQGDGREFHEAFDNGRDIQECNLG